MALGNLLRRLLGPLADPLIRLNRRLFIDLRSLGEILGRGPEPDTVLEIGCGDGHMCEVLGVVFPSAQIKGIDIVENPGWLFKGDIDRVEFRRVEASALAAEGERFDLVLINDVLHHVPPENRGPLLRAAWDLTARGGRVTVKDWIRFNNLATLASFLFERLVTGDRVAYFPTFDSLVTLVTSECEGGEVVERGTVPPHRNNGFLTLLKAH